MEPKDQAVSALKKARRKRERAQALRDEANRELASAIAAGRSAGVPVRAMAEAAGITTRSLYAIERGGGTFQVE